MTFPLRGLVAAACLFVLAACGGGGGGAGSPGGGGSSGGGNTPPPSGLAYVGSTTVADLKSSSVVPPLSGWLLLELGLTERLSSGGIATAKPSQFSMQKRLDKASKRVATIASKMTVQAVTNEACGVSGTTEINDDGLLTDGTGVVVFTFRNCAEGDGTTLNGVMRVTIAATEPAYFDPIDYTINYENVRITAGPDSIEENGSERVVITSSAITSTRNTVVRYLPDNVYLRLQDFVSTQSYDGQSTGLAFRGRFYHSQYGYVDVQTPVTLAVAPAFGEVIGGSMLLTGTVGAGMVELRFREQGLLSVVVDLNNDGVADRGLSARPSDLFAPNSNWAPMANAGADRTVDEGDLVTFNASENLDWEGAPVAVTWAVSSAPFGAAAIPPGSGAAYSFTPTVPGSYTVQLTVSDGAGGVANDRVVVLVRDIPGPLAHAGSDVMTMERATVTLDGSRTTYMSGTLDSVQFVWTRISGPANNTAPVTLTGMRPQATFDLPGAYEYRLNVSARGGGSTDTVRIFVRNVVGVSTRYFMVNADTQVAETTFEMPISVASGYAGPPLSLAISSDEDWLTIDTPNVTVSGTARVTVRLDLDVLESLPNGVYSAAVHIVPSGYSAWTGAFGLQLDLPELQQVTPYVVYTGQPTTVNLLGRYLALAADRVFVNGLQAQDFTRGSFSKGRVELPALTAGEHTVRVTNALGLERPGARLVVRNPPAHPDGEVTLPGRPYSMEYDAERDVFYGVFAADGGAYFARRFYRQADGTWHFDPIAVTNPRALTLGLGGERLYVTSTDCGVHQVDPVTLQVLSSATKASCFYEDFGLIGAFADGQVLVADTNQWSDVWRLPAFSQQYQLLPMIYSPIGVMSHDRSRLLWAESPSITGPHELYVLDVVQEPTPSPVAVNDGTTNFSRGNLAISGDGSRFMHRQDVYNDTYQYVGSLQGVGTTSLTPAVSRRGSRAAVYNNDTDELTLFDVSAGNSFPSLGVIDTFAADVSSLQLDYHPDDAAVFLWGMVRTAPSTYEYRLFVREMP